LNSSVSRQSNFLRSSRASSNFKKASWLGCCAGSGWPAQPPSRLLDCFSQVARGLVFRIVVARITREFWQRNPCRQRIAFGAGHQQQGIAGVANRRYRAGTHRGSVLPSNTSFKRTAAPPLNSSVSTHKWILTHEQALPVIT